ncbi:hypothetical protein STSP2_00499 [Anaerohalosphaera lusitana]|uniref:ATP-cone domain-containing protein n=1 Tax=Anaerohalosphaera lusitana TaxID=1936003 RepID=A0A1U9NHS7_9BACT|nr:hypothetical protein [Anaerohalosphaera lusitana]AQT67355.1 hypothetical protein STSP2_00499 [Anaerohalosphaera lusitana]
MHVMVVKADGSLEDYLHTKVLGSLNRAITGAGQADIFAAEQLAEAVTFHVYNCGRNPLTSGQIHSMVISVLVGTGNRKAAELLAEHRTDRQLRRRRIEVIGENGSCGGAIPGTGISSWDKSRIVADLVGQDGLNVRLARAVAGSVEEKVFGLGLSRIRKGLIRQIVLADLEAMIGARDRLEAMAG